jgi:oligosaccharide translocation protein RFT1
LVLELKLTCSAVSELRAAVRAIAEGLGLISKVVVTFLVLYYDDKERLNGSLALVAFALGQFAYGASVLLAYLVYYGPVKVLPLRLPKDNK